MSSISSIQASVSAMYADKLADLKLSRSDSLKSFTKTEKDPKPSPTATGSVDTKPQHSVRPSWLNGNYNIAPPSLPTLNGTWAKARKDSDRSWKDLQHTSPQHHPVTPTISGSRYGDPAKFDVAVEAKRAKSYELKTAELSTDAYAAKLSLDA